MLENAWLRIEDWLHAHLPAETIGLNPPASQAELAEAEQTLGVRLPEAVRASYLRHNGQSTDSVSLLYGWKWLTLNEICEEWAEWQEILESGALDDLVNEGDPLKLQSDWWHPGWIPLTASGNGDHCCLDLAPGPAGQVGQIIEVWHDDSLRNLLAPGFAEWITDYADALEAGEYVYSEAYQTVMHKDLLF